jgi:hypothetical protein
LALLLLGSLINVVLAQRKGNAAQRGGAAPSLSVSFCEAIA